MWLLVLACVEYELEGDSLPFDSPPIAIEPEAPDSLPVEEACDREDNDSDGEIDEGFADDDQNGRPDCLDGECAVALAAAGEASWNETCRVSHTIVDPWNVVLEWEYTGAFGTHIGTMPAVANVTDDDLDGDVDLDDVPDIAFVESDFGTSQEGRLYVITIS